jgi:hypothetical protein
MNSETPDFAPLKYQEKRPQSWFPGQAYRGIEGKHSEEKNIGIESFRMISECFLYTRKLVETSLRINCFSQSDYHLKKRLNQQKPAPADISSHSEFMPCEPI